MKKAEEILEISRGVVEQQYKSDYHLATQMLPGLEDQIISAAKDGAFDLTTSVQCSSQAKNIIAEMLRGLGYKVEDVRLGSFYLTHTLKIEWLGDSY